MQLFKKQNIFFKFLASLQTKYFLSISSSILKSTSNIEHFEKNGDSRSLCNYEIMDFPKLWTAK